MVEEMPQTPESKAFLELIKPYPTTGEQQSSEEGAADIAGSGRDSGGGAEGEEREEGGEDAMAEEVEKDRPEGPQNTSSRNTEVSSKSDAWVPEHNGCLSIM